MLDVAALSTFLDDDFDSVCLSRKLWAILPLVFGEHAAGQEEQSLQGGSESADKT